MERLKIHSLYDCSHTRVGELLKRHAYPWEILDSLASWIREAGPRLNREEFEEIAPRVWVARDAVVADSAVLHGPCIVDRGAQVRHGAFLRGSTVIGKDAVVGNSTEVKNALLFDGVQIPHFNYVGDSVLGYKAHLGAGAVCSNVKSDRSAVTVLIDGEKLSTRRKKFGAALGDGVEVGCNSVLCPGTVIGRNSTVYPLSRVRGFVPESCIFKDSNRIVTKQPKESERN